jgi:hypothetical protein
MTNQATTRKVVAMSVDLSSVTVRKAPPMFSQIHAMFVGLAFVGAFIILPIVLVGLSNRGNK